MRRLTILFVLSAHTAFLASASPQSEQHIQTMIETVHTEHGGSLATALVEEIDIDRTSRFILGRYARNASPSELDAFETRFKDYLVKFLKGRTYELEKADIEILGSTDRNAHDSIVTTRVSSPYRKPMLMRWRIIDRDGEWRLVDVEVHGIWLAIEHRAQISSLMGRSQSKIDDLYLQ